MELGSAGHGISWSRKHIKAQIFSGEKCDYCHRCVTANGPCLCVSGSELVTKQM